MINEVKVKPTDFNRYFKSLELKKRVSVLETAQILLKVQKVDKSILANANPPVETEKR